LTGTLQQPSLATIAIPTSGSVVQNIYAGVAQGLRYVAVNRYLPATAIVMSPSRWYGLASETDSEGRPLTVATGDGNTDAQLSDTDIVVGRFEDAARYSMGCACRCRSRRFWVSSARCWWPTATKRCSFATCPRLFW
jgi:hypothetical protein